MIGHGEPIPRVDYEIQHPEGLEVRNLILLLEENVAGHLYRPFVGYVSFDRFLVLFIAAFSSLAVVPVFLFSGTVWRSPYAGLFAAAFYTVSLPSFDRVTKSYLREEFALPFVFLFLFFFFRSLSADHKRSFWFAILSGLSLFIALSSWHLTQFFLLLFTLFVVISYLLGRHAEAAAHSDHRLILSFGVVVGFSLLAGVVNQPLRHKLFLISYSMLLAYAVLLTSFLLRLIGWRKSCKLRLPVLAVFLVLLVVATLPFAQHLSEYSHVYGLVLAKIRFFGIKPADPALLSADVRTLWMGPFNSPTPYSTALAFSIPLLIAIRPFARLMRRWWRRETSLGEDSLIYFAIVCLPLYMMVRRLSVFLIFFAAALAGYWGKTLCARFRDRFRLQAYSFSVVLSAVFLLQLHTAWNFERGTYFTKLCQRLPNTPEHPTLILDRNRWQIFEWIERETQPDAVFLARFPLSSMILAYANRPVVLPTVFELRSVRERVLECTDALYANEEELYRLCRKYDVDYILFDATLLLDDYPYGSRYMTDNLSLPANSAVYSLHFTPEKLEHFRLVYQTDYFRVYQALRPESPVEAATPQELAYAPQFDPVLFGVDRLDAISNSLLKEGLRRVTGGLAAYARGVQMLSRHDYSEAVTALTEAVGHLPGFLPPRVLLADVFMFSGDTEAAIEVCKNALRIDPTNYGFLSNLAAAYALSKRFDEGIATYSKLLALNPDDSGVHAKLGFLYAQTGQLELAIKELETSLRLNPANEEVRAFLSEIRAGEKTETDD
jgi:tetratricopeptide (TPR) repeat protein